MATPCECVIVTLAYRKLCVRWFQIYWGKNTKRKRWSSHLTSSHAMQNQLKSFLIPFLLMTLCEFITTHESKLQSMQWRHTTSIDTKRFQTSMYAKIGSIQPAKYSPWEFALSRILVVRSESCSKWILVNPEVYFEK